MLAAAPRLGARVVWGLIALFLTAFALTPVLLSHDAFSYLDYARLGVLHGLDPYVHPPSAAPADPVFARVTWTESTSAYGPLFTLATYPLAWLPVGVAVAVLKAVAALSVAALAATVSRVAAWRGLEPARAAAFVALNPLVLVHVVGGAHNDGLTMLVATLGVAAALSGLEATSAASLVAAAATKASALVLLPFPLLANLRLMGLKRSLYERFRPINRFLVGLGVAALVVGLAAYLGFGWEWTRAFGLAAENQHHTSHLSIPTTLARVVGIDEEPFRAAALVLYGLAFAALLIWTWRGGDWVRAAAWASFGLLLATSWLLPWYLVWTLPLVAVARDRTLALLTLALTAYQLGARIPL